jgi:hypothetical protein
MPVLAIQPETPMTERLRFLTDILQAQDGSEQRVNLRLSPRQEFDFTLLVENTDRQRLENRFFGAQTEDWSVPMWAEPMMMTLGATTGNSVLTVDSTDDIDIRTGDDVLVWADESTNEVLENITFTGTTITSVDSTLSQDFFRGSLVYVIRRSKLASNPRISRYSVNLTRYDLTYQVLDNTVDLADVSAWPSFNSIPVIDDPNCIETTLNEGWDRQVVVHDGATGVFSTDSFWDRSRRTSAKTFKSKTREQLMKLRKLLFWLRGQQRTFWLPTFGQDLTLLSDIASTDTVVNIVNNGYTTYTDARQPRNVIRIVLTNGTAYTKNIADAAEVSSSTEQITLTTPIGADVAVADIERIEILELVRSANDDFAIQHSDGLGQASISFPVKTVFE